MCSYRLEELTRANMRSLAFCLGALLLSCLGWVAGCGTGSPADGRRVVFVTIPPLAEFAERIGGDRVRVEVMIPAGADPHTYEPTPRQLTRLSAAQLYAQIGSGVDFEKLWMPRLAAINPQMRVINCGAGIPLVDGDPHIWLSPRHARVMARALAAGLSQVDPSHAADYAEGCESYVAQLDELDQFLAQGLSAAGVERFMVYHPSWGYFARDYGLEQISVEHEGKEPTARHLAHVIEVMRAARIGTIFVSPQFDRRSAAAVAAELGARVRMVDPLSRTYLAELRSFGLALMQANP